MCGRTRKERGRRRCRVEIPIQKRTPALCEAEVVVSQNHTRHQHHFTSDTCTNTINHSMRSTFISLATSTYTSPSSSHSPPSDYPLLPKPSRALIHHHPLIHAPVIGSRYHSEPRKCQRVNHECDHTLRSRYTQRSTNMRIILSRVHNKLTCERNITAVLRTFSTTRVMIWKT
jgi:hypothetical protein